MRKSKISKASGITWWGKDAVASIRTCAWTRDFMESPGGKRSAYAERSFLLLEAGENPFYGTATDRFDLIACLATGRYAVTCHHENKSKSDSTHPVISHSKSKN
jgi:hypothetical protein